MINYRYIHIMDEIELYISREVTCSDENVSVLWDVAKPNPVLTLEDLARLKSGLKRSHRRPARNLRQRSHRSRCGPTGLGLSMWL